MRLIFDGGPDPVQENSEHSLETRAWNFRNVLSLSNPNQWNRSHALKDTD